MSLNGLDASAVVEAHQAALADPGGWFLLKYANRDTVELLGRGGGGVPEVKNAVEQYEEKSPLYGLVLYRRKRVILKYVPVGTSRLLQVRLTVQFQSLTDAFPHDTVFSFNAASELTESALGLSAMLQPTNHGTSLSSAASVKHRRLDEISEDAEEPSPATQAESSASSITATLARARERGGYTHSVKSSLDSLPASALKAKALLARRKEVNLASELEQTTPTRAQQVAESEVALTPAPRATAPPPPPPLQPSTFSTFDKSLPATPQPTPPSSRHGLSRFRLGALAPPLPAESPVRVSFESPVSPVYHSSHLTHNESDNINKWNDQVTAYTASAPLPAPKPKQKRAPRPHVEPVHRPKTSNTSIANMPQSVRASSRANITVNNRPGSQQSSRSVPSRFVHPTPMMPPPLPTSTQLPSLFRAPDHRKPPSIASTTMTDGSTASPEKLRLMRALQLRKRNQLLAQRAATSLSQRAATSLEVEHLSGHTHTDSYSSEKTPVTPPVNDLVSRIAEETKSDATSATASPTSITTASGAHSTKPSSVAGDTDGKISVRQSVDDSQASSTPRANVGPERSSDVAAALEPVSRYAQTEDEATTEGAITPRSPLNMSSGVRDGAITPPGPQTVVHSATPESARRTSADGHEARPLEVAQANTLELPPRTSSRVDHSSTVREKRTTLLRTLKIPSSADVSVNSDDEAFMDELQNATLHEAKPVSVARTPATPKMRKLSVDKIRDMTRTNTADSVLSNSPETHRSRTASMRSGSTVTPHYPGLTAEEAAPVPLSKKSTLGSGISQRIKALEVVTHRLTSQGSTSTGRDSSANKSTFANLLNRASFIEKFASSGTSPPQQGSKQTAEESPRQTGHEPYTSSQPFMEPLEEVDEIFNNPKKGETISVTARIVREPRRPATSAARYHSEAGMGLHRSPLIVEHEKHENEDDLASTNASLSRKNLEHYQQSPAPEKSRFSFGSHRSGSTVKQHLSDGRTSRHSSASKDRRSSKALSETSSIADDKKSSKARSLMKRVSGLGNRFGHISHILSSKDNLPNDTILEQAEDDMRRASATESMLQIIDIGDVNVQFPETLLWKRKFMRIDDQGFLIFSAPLDNANVRVAQRNFHLSDLRTPTLPDLEPEGMAWSILLELRNGGCITCACENRRTQEHILKMLLDAHDAYNSLYH